IYGFESHASYSLFIAVTVDEPKGRTPFENQAAGIDEKNTVQAILHDGPVFGFASAQRLFRPPSPGDIDGGGNAAHPSVNMDQFRRDHAVTNLAVLSEEAELKVRKSTG